MAATDESIAGARAGAGVAASARVQFAPFQAMTSPTAAAFIREHGGSLYVWVTRFNCCGGPVRIVRSSTEPPRGLTGFRRAGAGEFQVLLHPSIGRPPAQMDVRLRGRWRPRITVYWDGIPI